MWKRTIIALIFTLSCVALLSTACTKDQALQTNPGIDCDSVGSVSWANDVLPILTTSCATGQGSGTGCHDSWISSYSSVKAKVNNGTFENRVIAVRDMPVPGNNFGIDVLTDEEIGILYCWMAQGSDEN